MYDEETAKLSDAVSNANYDSIGRRQETSKPSLPIIFCVHGNRYGMVSCCEELEPPSEDQKTPLTSGRRSADSEIGRFREDPLTHCHRDRNDSVDLKARRKLILASVLCVVFMIAEIVGGIMANSLAIATDAAHLLTDFASFMISLFSIWVAGRPATKRMSFGWHRAEVIGATVSVLLIWVVTGILAFMAVQRIVYRDFEVNAEIMLITSGIGIAFNIIMGCSLHQHGHTHGGHGHGDHGSSEGGNINVKAAYIHVLGDFLQSIGVFIAALILYFKPTWVLVDPICTFLFSVLVLFTTVKILGDTMNVLMEGIPKSVNFNTVQEIFLSVEGVMMVHNVRIWGITTDKTALSAHLAIHPSANPQEVLKLASLEITRKYDFYEMTLQVEEFVENMEDCNQCRSPQT